MTNVDVAVEPVTGGACEVRCSKCNVSVDGVTPFYSLWHMPHHTIPYHTIPYQTRPGPDHGIYYPASAWLIQLRAYAMPSVPVPPITLT